jgi:hypothetical protein
MGRRGFGGLPDVSMEMEEDRDMEGLSVIGVMSSGESLDSRRWPTSSSETGVDAARGAFRSAICRNGAWHKWRRDGWRFRLRVSWKLFRGLGVSGAFQGGGYQSIGLQADEIAIRVNNGLPSRALGPDGIKGLNR